MRTRIALLLTMAMLAGSLPAQQGEAVPGWQLAAPTDPAPGSPLDLFGEGPLGLSSQSPLVDRPRLRVALSPGPRLQQTGELPSFSWSLEAWEMNTASLAHIQCARATRTIESFLVENCRFVDQPLPDDSASLVQVRGRWMATPNLSVSAGAYTGERSAAFDRPVPLMDAGGLGTGLPTERVEGVNMNVSFGLRMGQIGDLLLDLQVERYRQTPDSFSLRQGMVPAFFGAQNALPDSATYRNAGQVGVGWRGNRFSADLTGQYQELPFWMSEQLDERGFRSFDIEFSWRAPARSSISVGVSNVLGELPGAAATGDQGVEEALDGIYGRIPYVRYKHDL